MSNNVYRQRLDRLQKEMKKQKFPALLITNVINLRYLTGLDLSLGALLLSTNEGTLYIDGRYAEVARSKNILQTAKYEDLLRDLRPLRKLAIEEHDLTVARFTRLQKALKNTKLIHSKSLVEGLRKVKDASEIRSIQTAILLTKKVLQKVPSMLKGNVTERQVALRIEQESIGLGAERMSFDTIVAFGENSSRPHHHPTNRRLRKDDIVQIDMGVKVDGYCSDMSRVFFLASKTPEQKKVYRALEEAKKSAEKLVQPGVDVRRLDRVAREVLKSFGYTKEFCHSLGHGVGLEIHETPTLSMKVAATKLRKGEVITIEPGLYFPGEWGMRIEDTIIVR